MTIPAEARGAAVKNVAAISAAAAPRAVHDSRRSLRRGCALLDWTGVVVVISRLIE
jgi:hypothetical protein